MRVEDWRTELGQASVQECGHSRGSGCRDEEDRVGARATLKHRHIHEFMALLFGDEWREEECENC